MDKNILMGKKIKEAREKKDLSQKDFAKLLNVSQASVSKYESGENIPRMNKLKQISSILDTPLSYFLEESQEKSEKKELIPKNKKEIRDVIEEFCQELGLFGKKDGIIDEPLLRYCISKIESGEYDTKKQLLIIRFLKLIEEISEIQKI